eukprot:COSAG05_NODE_82_length_20915_cov_5.306399_7_plen_52_part_00
MISEFLYAAVRITARKNTWCFEFCADTTVWWAGVCSMQYIQWECDSTIPQV